MAKPKYPQSEALELARLNAIRLLGLHENNTPEDRARAMGFDWDNLLYHGTQAQFPQFKNGEKHSTYATEDPNIAEIYATAGGRQGNAAPNIIPLVARGKKLKVSDYHESDPEEYSSGWFGRNIANRLGIPRKPGMIKQLPKHGYDRLEITDMDDVGGQQSQHVFPEPHVLRSRFAAFDPARAHEAGLSYAKGGDVEPTPDQMREMLAQSGHLTSTPLKPHAAVGQRYGVSEATGLAPKNDVDLEQHKGSSVMVMPWDSTSRNVRVHSISGHELPEHITTHGGQDYARDLEHILQGVAGASGNDIAKKIATREAIARMENENQGGTGQLLHMPITMGERGEDFSMTPTEILHQLVMRGMLPPEELARMNNEIRAHKITKSGKKIQPFGGFVGLEHPEFDQQIVGGHGLGTTAGELRKAIVDRIGYMKHNQKALDFNIEDLVNAVTDPALRGVPKGYIGNTVIGSDPDHMTLTPSSNKAYDTNFSGQYLGTLGHSFPAEILFGDKMAELQKEFEGKKADPRTMALGALEKRKANISQILNNETLDRYGKYLLAREKKLRTGHYAEGGEVKAEEPSHDEMLAHVMLHGMTSLKDVGANEAPNMQVKTYVPQGPGPGFPVGGVDFQPKVKGQQMLPGQPGQPPGQPGQPPAPAGGQMPPTGQPPAPGEPQSNILQMTPQGQAMAAMKATPPPPMAKKRGGVVYKADGGGVTGSGTLDLHIPLNAGGGGGGSGGNSSVGLSSTPSGGSSTPTAGGSSPGGLGGLMDSGRSFLGNTMTSHLMQNQGYDMTKPAQGGNLPYVPAPQPSSPIAPPLAGSTPSSPIAAPVPAPQPSSPIAPPVPAPQPSSPIAPPMVGPGDETARHGAIPIWQGGIEGGPPETYDQTPAPTIGPGSFVTNSYKPPSLMGNESSEEPIILNGLQQQRQAQIDWQKQHSTPQLVSGMADGGSVEAMKRVLANKKAAGGTVKDYITITERKL